MTAFAFNQLGHPSAKATGVFGLANDSGKQFGQHQRCTTTPLSFVEFGSTDIVGQGMLAGLVSMISHPVEEEGLLRHLSPVQVQFCETNGISLEVIDGNPQGGILLILKKAGEAIDVGKDVPDAALVFPVRMVPIMS